MRTLSKHWRLWNEQNKSWKTSQMREKMWTETWSLLSFITRPAAISGWACWMTALTTSMALFTISNKKSSASRTKTKTSSRCYKWRTMNMDFKNQSSRNYTETSLTTKTTSTEWLGLLQPWPLIKRTSKAWQTIQSCPILKNWAFPRNCLNCDTSVSATFNSVPCKVSWTSTETLSITDRWQVSTARSLFATPKSCARTT